MAFHVELYRYSMEFHGTPWKSMELHGIPWNSMELHEYSMELHGYFDPWILRISHELTDETSFGVGNKYVHLNWSLNFSGQENLFFLYFFVFFLLFYYFKRCCDNPFYGRKKLELLFASFWSLIRNEPIYINVVVIRKAISYLGTTHYLSHWGRGGGTEDFSGDHLIFRRTKGGISRNWEPERGNRWKLWKGSEGGPLKFAWKVKTWGGDCESHQKLLGGITSVK